MQIIKVLYMYNITCFGSAPKPISNNGVWYSIFGSRTTFGWIVSTICKNWHVQLLFYDILCGIQASKPLVSAVWKGHMLCAWPYHTAFKVWNVLFFVSRGFGQRTYKNPKDQISMHYLVWRLCRRTVIPSSLQFCSGAPTLFRFTISLFFSIFLIYGI